MTGALPAVQERLPCAVDDVDVIVGTSAGSVVAAALRCGIGLDEMVAYQRGEAVGVLLAAGVRDIDTRPLPPPPRLRVGSPKLMLTTLLTPHRVHPWVGVSALLPRGRARHVALRAMVHAMHSHAHAHGHAAHAGHTPVHGAPGGNGGPGYAGHLPDWIDRGQTWIVAVNYDSGRRVIFGREGAPRAQLTDAVVASCSIPGWYEPAVIDGRRYVDGGVRSATSLGVLSRSGLHEVYVLAPMASLVPDRPSKPLERLERRLRRLITAALLREVEALRRSGAKVTVLTPGPDDLAAMGVNLMDPRRRMAVVETSLHTSAAALANYPAERPRVA